VDETGCFLAVAGNFGLAHYTLTSRKWKVFGNVMQEKDMVVTGECCGGHVTSARLWTHAGQNGRLIDFSEADRRKLLKARALLPSQKRARFYCDDAFVSTLKQCVRLNCLVRLLWPHNGNFHALSGEMWPFVFPYFAEARPFAPALKLTLIASFTLSVQAINALLLRCCQEVWLGGKTTLWSLATACRKIRTRSVSIRVIPTSTTRSLASRRWNHRYPCLECFRLDRASS